ARTTSTHFPYTTLFRSSRKGGSSKGPYASLNLGGTNGDDPSAVLANHEKLFKVFGRPYSSRFDVWQVHGKTILFSEAPRPPEKRSEEHTSELQSRENLV